MRHTQELNSNWQIGKCESNVEIFPIVNEWQDVTVPHVWNKNDQKQEGKRVYKTSFTANYPLENHKYFIAFNAVAGVCKAWLNGVFLGEHRGGYSRFCFCLSKAVQQGENELIVLADNIRYNDIIPLGGDFTNYGGIYRSVELVVTQNSHFDLLYHGTNGLLLRCLPSGELCLESRIICPEHAEVVYFVFGQSGQWVAQKKCQPNSKATIMVENPHYWNGQKDPYLYRCVAKLFVNETCVDQVELPFGFRSIEITAENGFALNGAPMKINGVAKHQDNEQNACATTKQQLDKDMSLLKEIGCNAVRLSHYQHPEYFYDLCDKEGLVVWAEIPMLSMPDGNQGVLDNAKKQLTELVLQCQHHPSICFWGIQNEIAMMGESLEMYQKTQQLQDHVKALDPTRISTSANLYCVKNNSQLNFITDMVGYNIYFGWYYGEMEEFESFFDAFHTDNPTVALGVSEYGVDCSLQWHANNPKRKDYSEEFQCLYHENVYAAIQSKPYLWGSFVWNMFDFGSSIRNEGGVKGKNCKGLVSFDRQTKKDSFYYYKAQWAKEPFVHIAGKRFQKRHTDTTTIKVYSNQNKVTLSYNGTVTQAFSHNGVFLFNNIPFIDSKIVATATIENGSTDTISLEKVNKPENSYIYIDPNPEFNVKNWFTLEQGADELFPQNKYSIMDEMGTLIANEKVCQVLDQYLPQLAKDPRSKSMPSITLLRVINRISGQLQEEKIKELNQKLNAIVKN